MNLAFFVPRDLKARERPPAPPSNPAADNLTVIIPFVYSGIILVRLLLPPTLLVCAAPYFLPHNSANVRAYLSRVEDTHFPEFAAQHTQLVNSLHDTFAGTWDRAEKLTGDVRRATGGVVNQVEQATGLKLGEALGRARELGDGVRREIAREAPETAAEGDSHARVVGVVMEQQPVAEIVAQPAADSAAARRKAESDARRVGSAFERAMQSANLRDVHVAEPVAAAAQTNKEAVKEAGKDIKQAVKGAAKSAKEALQKVAEPEVSSRQDGGKLANSSSSSTLAAPLGVAGDATNPVVPKASLPHESGPGGLVEPLLGKEESKRLV